MIHKALAVVALVVAPGAVSAAGHWYEGGTLHQATIEDWAGALTQNKMATAADMVVGAKVAKRKADIVEMSVRLASCLDEVARDKASYSQEVAAMAAMCIALERG